MDILLDAAVEVKIVLVAALHALLKSPLGRGLLRLSWRFVEPCLLATYVSLKYLIGPIARRLHPPTRVAIRSILIRISQFFSLPVISNVLREILCLVLMEGIGIRFGPDAQQELAEFLLLGEDKKKYQQLAIKWGSGKPGDFCNRFFPQALARGPATPTDGTRCNFYREQDPRAKLTNIQIAESVLLMSIISYRDDFVIRECMKNGMFPNVRYYSVRTASDTDLSIFLGKKWAVFAFRGTEFETMRDVLTSTIVEDTIPFSGNSRVRRRYYQSMRTACGESRSRRYEVEPPISLPGRLNATVLDLVKLLSNDEIMIYATGHSLGGGLATLFGAHIKEHLNVSPAAIISFGSPPVAGNDSFVRWYRNAIPHSWRFVYGDEFGPMCPPLPFTSSVHLQHVDSLIDVRNLRCVDPDQNSYEEQKLHLDHLARTMKLFPLLFDHNPILTMRVLHLEATRAEQFISMSLHI